MGRPRGGYYAQDGTKLSSVTEVLGRFKDSGGLLFWAHKVGREQEAVVWKNRIGRWGKLIHDEVPSAYFAAPMDKLLSTDTRQRIENGTWTDAPESTRLYDVSEKAAAAGTLAHDAIEAFILSKGSQDFAYEWPESDHSTRALAANAFAQFLDWYGQTKIQITDTEYSSASEKHGFAGTLDAVGVDAQGRVVLLDWKTSNAIYPDYLIQLAAYAILLEENRGIKVDSYHIVRVAKESADFAHASFRDLEHEKATFLKMVELHGMVKKIEKRVK